MTTLSIQSIEGRDNIGDLGDTLAVPLYTYNIHLHIYARAFGDTNHKF